MRVYYYLAFFSSIFTLHSVAFIIVENNILTLGCVNIQPPAESNDPRAISENIILYIFYEL